MPDPNAIAHATEHTPALPGFAGMPGELRTSLPGVTDSREYFVLIDEAEAGRVEFADAQRQAEMLAAAKQAAAALHVAAATRANTGTPSENESIVQHLRTLRSVSSFCVGQAMSGERVNNVLLTAVVMGAVAAYQTQQVPGGHTELTPLAVAPPFPCEAAAVRSATSEPAQSAAAAALVLAANGASGRQPSEANKLSPVKRLLADAESRIAEIVAYAKEHGANPNRQTFQPVHARAMFRVHGVDIASAKHNVVSPQLGLSYHELVLVALFRDPRFGNLRNKKHIKVLRQILEATIDEAYDDQPRPKPFRSPGRPNHPKS